VAGLRVVQAAPVAGLQKIVAVQAALEIPHQHHRPKALVVEQLLPAFPKVHPEAVVHLLQEQVELVPVR
jgi:hypothetical protein